MQPFSAYHLITLYICTKFLEKKSPRISELLRGHILKFTKGYYSLQMWVELRYLLCTHRLILHILKFTKGYNSIKNVGEVTVLVLCTSLYI